MAFFLDDILMSPTKLVTWIGKTLQDRAEEQLTDESVIHERLWTSQTKLELGEITDDQYLRKEDALMQRLNAIHKYKEARK